MIKGTAKITSAKGVRKAVNGYLSHMEEAIDAFVAGYQLDELEQKSWKKRVKERCEAFRHSSSVPRDMLPHLRRYQTRQRGEVYALTLDEVKSVGLVPHGLRRASDL